jgi:hypothetical protein
MAHGFALPVALVILAFVKASFAKLVLAVTAIAACDAITSVAVSGADFGGATADAHCDRRFVSDGGRSSSFCQEIVGTLAASQFADDCRSKHEATSGTGLCPRQRIIAGCKLDQKNSDNSLVWDWYYDVSDIIADAGSMRTLPDGGSELLFEPPTPQTVTDVADACADRLRYEMGAELVQP